MMKFFMLFGLLLFTACAQSSGVLKMGPDTYSVSVHAAPARGGEAGAKKIALMEANQYCLNLNQEIMVTNTSSGASSHFPGGTVDITFLCLASNDPALKRPVLESVPDIVIESR